jgi:DNA-directed RNA polymerase specialized sigma24 family protein
MEIIQYCLQLRNGENPDRKAGEKFYNKSYGLLKAKLIKSLREYDINYFNTEDIEDVIFSTIEVFLKMLRTSFTGEHEGQAVNYLYLVLRSELRKYITKNEPLHNSDEIIDENEKEVHDALEKTNGNHPEAELKESLIDCIERLPKDNNIDLSFIMSEIMRGIHPAIIARQLNVETELVKDGRRLGKELVKACLENKGIKKEDLV